MGRAGMILGTKNNAKKSVLSAKPFNWSFSRLGSEEEAMKMQMEEYEVNALIEMRGRNEQE